MNNTPAPRFRILWGRVIGSLIVGSLIGWFLITLMANYSL